MRYDSLNPVAITQQFVLQGMVRKRNHIWYFIWATYLTNFIFGMTAYYGLLAILARLWNRIFTAVGEIVFIAEFILGILFLAFAVRSMITLRTKAAAKNVCEDNSEAEAIKNKIKSVSPLSLFSLGVIATIMELTSALPYFAFLGMLLQYPLSLPDVIFIQALYNLIYASPLMLMYFIYCRKQTLFDRVYTYVKCKMEKLSDFVAPVLLTAAGIFLICMLLVGS